MQKRDSVMRRTPTQRWQAAQPGGRWCGGAHPQPARCRLQKQSRQEPEKKKNGGERDRIGEREVDTRARASAVGKK